MRKLALSLSIALAALSPALAQSPPFNPGSIATLGGNCGATGSLPYQASGGITQCLGIGTAGQQLVVSGSTLAWGTAAAAGTIASGTANALGYYASAGTTLSPLAAGTNGFVLTMVSGVPAWAAATPSFTSQSANTFLAAPNGSAGVPTFRLIASADIPTTLSNTTTIQSTTALGLFSASGTQVRVGRNGVVEWIESGGDGHFGPLNDNTFDFGAPTARPIHGYFINAGDATTPITNGFFSNIATGGQGARAEGIISQGGTPSVAPSSLATWASYATSFTGDNSQIQHGIKYNITGAATAGQPTTGYVFTPELSARVTYYQNASGWNQSTSAPTGRTGVAAETTFANQTGGGDIYAHWASVAVSGAKAGATNFLANPAGTILGGQTMAAQAGVYLQGIGDINLGDNGFDVAGIGMNMNLNRTNVTGALGAYWTGYRIQSVGTSPLDNMFYGVGPTRVGIDLSPITTQTSGTWQYAAITLKASDRIYLNATAGPSGGAPSSTGTDYIAYSGSGPVIVSGGSGVALFSPSLQTFSNHIAHTQTTGSTTVSACGTSPIIDGDDRRGTVTFGSGTPNVCTINFSVAYATAPKCVVSGNSATIFVYRFNVATTGLVIGSSASYPGGQADYICEN